MAKFRKYATPEEGIKGYYEFLQYKRYQNLKGVTDYNEACDLIRKDGWATSLAYAQNLKNLIASYGLTAYDEKALGLKVTAIAATVQPEFVCGNYKVTALGLKVRAGAGTSYSQKKFSQMSRSARALNSEYKSGGLALYKKGIVFTAQEVIKISDNEYWAKTPSGYVALKYDGTVYVEKM